jgi:hypothetical protein
VSTSVTPALICDVLRTQLRVPLHRAQEEHPRCAALYEHGQRHRRLHVHRDPLLRPAPANRLEQRVFLNVRNENGSLRADRLLDLRVALEVDAQVTDGGVLVHRDDASLVFPGRREHEGAVGEAKRMPHPTDQRLEDLVGAQGRGDLLEDVEQQVARSQGILGLAQLVTQTQVGVDAGAQLTEVHGARHGVPRARLQRIRHGVGPAVRHEDDDRCARVACPGRQIAYRVRQPRLLGGDGEDQEIGRLVLRTVGAEWWIGGVGDLEAASYQEPLEPVRSGPGVADEEDSVLDLFRQRS